MKLKYPRLITVLTELALVCLVFVTIVACIPRTISLQLEPIVEQNDNNLSLSVDKEASSDKGMVIIDGTAQDGHYISGSFANGDASGTTNRVEIQTDESGKHFFVVDSPIEAVTDENGNVFYQVNTQPDLNAGNTVGKLEPVNREITYSPSPVTIIVYVIDVLACVLLLLYALKFYNHSNAAQVMGLIFTLSLIASAIPLFMRLRHVTTDFIIFVIGHLLKCILFALMAALALKNKLSPKVSLIAMIGILVSIAMPFILGGSLGGLDMLDTIVNLLGLIGLASFTVAWFLCSFKEPIAAPSEESTEPLAPAAE